MDHALILRQKEHVESYMHKNDLQGAFTYHNWAHVTLVISSLAELLLDYDLDNQHTEDILLAAIWHDADFAKGRIGHEMRSATLAAISLKEEGLEESRIDRIKRLILCTHLNYSPLAEDEKIIRDSDLSYLGRDEFYQFYIGLYQERVTFSKVNLTAEAWRMRSIKFMETHAFYTAAAQQRFNEKKEQNLQGLIKASKEKK